METVIREKVNTCDDVYIQEFQKSLQAQKRFREAWLESEASWNYELFQYANEDFYFYRFGVQRQEKETKKLIKRIVLRLLDKCSIKYDSRTKAIDFAIYRPNGRRIGFSFSDPCVEDIEAICKDGHLSGIIIICTWKEGVPDTWIARNNNQHKENGRRVREVSLRGFFEEYFGAHEYECFEKHLKTYMEEVREIMGYRAIKYLSSMNLATQKIVAEKNLLEFARKETKYTVIDKDRKEVAAYAYVDNYVFPDNIQKEIAKRYISSGIYKSLLGTSDYAESFITSEWLFHSLKDTQNYDLTSIVSGYLKSIEQLLFRIVQINIDNNCKIQVAENKKEDVRNKNIERYAFNKKKDGFERINGSKAFKREYIEFTSENEKYIDRSLGAYEYFLRYNPSVFMLQLLYEDNQVPCYKVLLDMVSCFRAECRNGYFHTHNLKDWDTVKTIRDNALLLYVLLLGGCTIPETKYHDIGILQFDWFDELCVTIRKNRHVSTNYIFEYPDGRQECLVYDRQDNTKEYTNDGIEHYESLKFFKVKDFSITSYELLDMGIQEECIVFLTRNTVPQKIWCVDRNNNRIIVYDKSI